MKVIVVNGRERSGKDSFAEICMKVLEKDDCGGFITSMVDCAKDIADYIGWKGDKTPRNRKFLSDLKDLIDEWGDCSFKWVAWKIDSTCEDCYNCGDKEPWAFVMARQPEDIERLQKEFNAIAVCVRRDSAEKVEASNHADANVFNYTYDYYIDNNGNLDDLRAAAETFIELAKGDEREYVWSY